MALPYRGTPKGDMLFSSVTTDLESTLRALSDASRDGIFAVAGVYNPPQGSTFFGPQILDSCAQADPGLGVLLVRPAMRKGDKGVRLPNGAWVRPSVPQHQGAWHIKVLQVLLEAEALPAKLQWGYVEGGYLRVAVASNRAELALRSASFDVSVEKPVLARTVLLRMFVFGDNAGPKAYTTLAATVDSIRAANPHVSWRETNDSRREGILEVILEAETGGDEVVLPQARVRGEGFVIDVLTPRQDGDPEADLGRWHKAGWPLRVLEAIRGLGSHKDFKKIVSTSRVDLAADRLGVDPQLWENVTVTFAAAAVLATSLPFGAPDGAATDDDADDSGSGARPPPGSPEPPSRTRSVGPDGERAPAPEAKAVILSADVEPTDDDVARLARCPWVCERLAEANPAAKRRVAITLAKADAMYATNKTWGTRFKPPKPSCRKTVVGWLASAPVEVHTLVRALVVAGWSMSALESVVRAGGGLSEVLVQVGRSKGGDKLLTLPECEAARSALANQSGRT